MAASTEYRRTGTIAAIVEDHRNDWTDFSGIDINLDVAYKEITTDEWDQAHWAYRGQAAMCKTVDGTKLVRVRIGDGSSADRAIYYQEITDPSVAAQWETWTQLYSGSHYAVAVEATSGSIYRVIHAKSDGIYVSNVLKISQTNVTAIKVVRGGASGQIVYQVVGQDTDGDRYLDWYHCSNVATPATSVADPVNYTWYRYPLYAMVWSGNLDYLYTFRGLALDGGARDKTASQVLCSTWGINVDTNEWQNMDVISGPSGQAGYKVFDDLFVTALFSNGDRFLFFTVQHKDSFGGDLANLHRPLYWCRGGSGAPQDWGEPTPIGYSVWGFAGVEEFGNYVYAAGNGRVLQRPLFETETILSDYVIEGSYDLPRNNEKATGALTCANPANVVGEAVGLIGTTDAGMTEKRLRLYLGTSDPTKTADADNVLYDSSTTPYDSPVQKYDGPSTDAPWTWKQDALWWVSNLFKTQEDALQHLTIEIADFWHRMENSFKDTIAIRGQLNWKDWEVGGQNQLSNYTNADSEFQRVADSSGDFYHLKTTAGITLFAGWRGENGSFSMVWTSVTGKAIFRYQDASNYMYAEYNRTKVRLVQVLNGTETELASTVQAPTAGFYFTVDFRWKHIRVYYNFALKIDYTFTDPPILVGFVGVGESQDAPFEMHHFEIYEWHLALQTKDLLVKLLHYADIFDVTVNIDLTDAEQINVLWGPQSDLSSPAKAFRAHVDAGKLDVAYRDEDGLVHIDRFGVEDPDYGIENEIISYAHTSEGKARPNYVSVDGNDDSWTQYDQADLRLRGHPIVDYQDLPELLTPGEVRSRANQEIIDATRYNSPGGDVVWRPDYNIKDTIYWVDEFGNTFKTRIEGLHVAWSQGMSPFQHATIDAGSFIYCPPESLPGSYVARDVFKRDDATGWGDAQTGGTWTLV